jgi:NAD dependent epimerase/dehydratase family
MIIPVRAAKRRGVRGQAARASHGDCPTRFVTGGAGFVGSHACKALSRAGYLPVTFDNLERGHETAVE